MKTSSLFGIMFGIIVLMVVIHHETPERTPYKCQEVGEARVNSSDEFNIVYCKDNGLVWHDSTWVEPTFFEERMIQMSESERVLNE